MSKVCKFVLKQRYSGRNGTADGWIAVVVNPLAQHRSQNAPKWLDRQFNLNNWLKERSPFGDNHISAGARDGKVNPLIAGAIS